MDITEIRVKLMHNRTDRLRAFCSITIDDDFVVHDLRVIEGRKGLFVAMPSRKLTDNCPKCGTKNELRAKYCGECGQKLSEKRVPSGAGRDKFHVDVAHPINTPCREQLQDKVLAAYQEEESRSLEGLPPLHEYAADEYDDEETSQHDDVGDEESGGHAEAIGVPPEEQVDLPALEGEPETGPAATEDGARPDLKPLVEAPGPEAPGPSEETPSEFGELTPAGEPVMPSESLGEPAGPAPEEEEPAEAEDVPEGAAGVRRTSRRQRKGGGFGEGIL